MTSRERILCALDRGQPDRVPYCEVGVSGKLLEALGGGPTTGAGGIDEMDTRDPALEIRVSQLLRRDNICYRMQPTIPVERHTGADGIDFYGEGQVRTQQDLDLVDLPDPDDPALWEPARCFLEGSEDFATCLATRAGISPVYLAMGMESFAVALYEDRDLVEALLDRYTNWAVGVVKKAAELGFDFLWTSDDLAFKTGSLFSPDMFREIFLPHLRKVADAVSIPWVFHSDGDLGELIPDLLDLGISALNPIEPEAMDIVEVKRRWGHRVCLIGNVSVDLLAAGEPEQVREEVRRLVREVAPGGGYMLSSGNSLASYCKPGNVRAMVEELAVWGAYETGSLA
ncbi:MAG: hypothetical protein O2954_06635 [bacterium]|nr:hypothetical protein [bacterium]